MATNYYHIINFIPGIEKEEMLVGHEHLAKKIVESGRFRIDAGNKINFARLYVPNHDISMMFSKRELYDKNLIPRTKEIIAEQFSSSYTGSMLDTVVNKHINLMRKEVSKYIDISNQEEMRLARLVVQCAHPAVIMLILLDNTEIFLSHSYNIGDMLDISSWRTCGSNSGMQSTDGRDAAIFISCGGDPLKENEEENATYGDGWPAIARLLVIGGQEIGHYSDIKRDKDGSQISRYSADLGATKPKPHVRDARRQDIRRDKDLLSQLYDSGFKEWLDYTKQLKFFDKQNRGGWIKLKTKILIYYHSSKIKKKVQNTDLAFLEKFYSEDYPAIMIQAVFDDMLFNLSPQADVYKRDNPVEEEAIACIEALARIPQQVNKWGRGATKSLMKDLYRIYYKEVIPGCIMAYQNMTGNLFNFDTTPEKQSLIYKIKKFFGKKTYPSRDI
ncbi:MAG: DUF2748 family protein [Rickettsiales bacterium]